MNKAVNGALTLAIATLAGVSTAQPVASVTAPASAVVSGAEAQASAHLRALVLVSVDRSPAVREAQSNWRAANQEVLQSRAGLWPRIELSANSGAARLESGGPGLASASLGVTATYTVMDHGRQQRQIEARGLQAASLAQQVLVAGENNAFETVTAYLQLIKQQRLIRIYERHIAELSSLVDKLTATVRVFVGRRSELTQAQARLEQARDALLGVKAREAEYALILRRQVGVAASGLPNALPALPQDQVNLLVEEAALQHPAMRAARAESAALRTRLAEIQAGQKPFLDLQASKQTGTDAYGFGSPAQVYLTAKWLAFDGDAGKAEVGALLERARSADDKADQLLFTIAHQIQAAHADFEAQTRRIQVLGQLIDGTDQVRRDMFDQWRELGRRSLLEVLTAESEHLNTQLNLASSEVDQVLALARMRHEAGTLAAWLLPANHPLAAGAERTD
jgi:outer membrane protein, adhesin transport system